MKRLAIGILLLLSVLVVAVAWVGEISITGPRREWVERLASRALGAPVRFASLRLGLAPTVIEVTNLFVGDRGIAAIGHLHVEVFALSSLREGRPVLALKVESPMIDLTQLPHEEDKDDEDEGSRASNPLASIPPLRVARLTVRDVRFRFRMGKDPVDVVAESIQGDLQRPVLRAVLEASIGLKGAEWRRKQFGFRVDLLSAAGGADEQGVWVESASADGPTLSLRASATNVKHRHDAVATLDPAMLGAFVDELALIGGALKIEGTVSGNIIDPIVDARLTLRQSSFARRPIGDLSTHFTRKRSRLAFEDVRIDGDVGSASGAAELVVYREVPIQADVHWDRINLEKLLTVIGAGVPFHNVLDGQTQLAGTLDPLDLRIRGSGTAQPIEAERAHQIAAWNATTRILPHWFEARAQVEQVGNQIAADVAITGSELGGHVDATIADLDALSGLLPQPVPQLNLSGRGDVAVQLGGSVEHPTLRGELQLAEGAVDGTALEALRGDVSIAAGHLTTSNLHLAAGGGEGALSGTVALTAAARNDWKLGLRDVATDLVVGVAEKFIGFDLPIGEGALTSSVACSGAWTSARLDAELSAQALRIYDEPFASMHVKLRAPSPAWEAELELAHAAQEIVTAKASGKSWDNVDLSVSSDTIRLAGIQRLARPDLRGSLRVGGRLSGRWREPSGRIELTATGLAQADRQLGDVDIVASGEQGRWNAHASALGGQVEVDATLRAQPPFAYTIAVRLKDADLTKPILGDSPSQLGLSADLNLSGDLSDLYSPSGTVRVSDFHLRRDVHVVEEVEPFVFELTRGRLAIRSLSLQYEDSRLSVSGAMSTNGDLQLEAHGQGDLVLLELFDLPIAAARGPFSIRAAASYSAGAGWNLDGEGKVEDVIVDLGLPLAFTRTHGAVVLRDDEIRIEGLEGRAGGGQFQLSGKIDLRNGPALEWKAEEVGFGAAEGLELKVTGHGRFAGTWERPLVSGSVEVLNALYDRNFDWADVLPWLLEQLAGRPLPRVRTIERPIGLDFIVYSRGGVFVDNNLANLEAWLDLQIRGDTAGPVISGRVGFLDGEVFLRGRKFTITGGTVDFRDYYRNNPLINISAEGRVVSPETDYGITMIVSGTASNPRIQFNASDPTLSQTDVFSLATFGKTSAQLQREGGGVSAADALALVPTGEVEKRVGQLVGFDRFQVETVQSRSTGAIEPRVTIGKDLTDQLRALAWTSFGVESRHAVQLEYRMTRRISLLGAWESDTRSGAGAFGGDVKFRYEFRRIRFSLLDDMGESSR